ncbi:putative integral membrane protein [Botrytis fragariae]|uniref:Putative integral membrane protein n=1 Tax=Botrytis fragariae TaxID=1964551 RepID=A0A8H6AZH2_9HELO|nr:putative integral membrane protein [Botrytis fragariae]KAF5876295.1 putative integral membrane protein [Botrytis fragariae]
MSANSQSSSNGDINIGWKLELQALITTIVDFVAVHYGLSQHTSYLKYNEAVHQQYYNLLAQVFCVQALSFAKTAIVILYLRVIHGSGIRIHQVLL